MPPAANAIGAEPLIEPPASLVAPSPRWGKRTCRLCPGSSDVNLLRYGQGIIDLDAEVPDGAFDLCVTEQEPSGSQVAGAPVDQGYLCSS